MSRLLDIQPSTWLPETTSELVDLLNVLGLLVELEPRQADLLGRVVAGPLLAASELEPGTGTGSVRRSAPDDHTVPMFDVTARTDVEGP